MELIRYILGACLCMYCTLAVVAFASRSKEAPYREAFGWVCTVCGLQILCDILAKESSALAFLAEEPFVLIRDFSIIPFCAMEIFCLYRQDVEVFPWKKRWLWVGICEVPFVLFALLMWLTEWEGMRWIFYAYIAVFMLLILLRDGIKLREYSYLLSLTPDNNNRSIRWVGWIYASYILLFCLYIISSIYHVKYMEETYLLCSMANFFTHSYFLAKQRPENSQYMDEVRQILRIEQERFIKEVELKTEELELKSEELEQKSIEIENTSKEIKENAEKLKRKADMKEYMDAMLLEHPHFARRLRAATDNRLTSHDIFLCMLIYDGNKGADVATRLGIGSRSVEVARSRLRKKFNMEANEKLADFIKKVVKSETPLFTKEL